MDFKEDVCESFREIEIIISEAITKCKKVNTEDDKNDLFDI